MITIEREARNRFHEWISYLMCKRECICEVTCKQHYQSIQPLWIGWLVVSVRCAKNKERIRVDRDGEKYRKREG